jgi:transcriptional regulator with XRE-family HTH domain
MRQNRRASRQSAFLLALGAAVRVRRASLKLTVGQLAARLGESPAAVKRLESGSRNVSVLQLAAIARALQLSLGRLLRLVERRVR